MNTGKLLNTGDGLDDQMWVWSKRKKKYRVILRQGEWQSGPPNKLEGLQINIRFPTDTYSPVHINTVGLALLIRKLDGTAFP